MAEHTARDSSALVDLVDDILDIIGSSLTPRDICNINMCCKTLNNRVSFDKIWLTECEKLEVLSSIDLVEWRRAFLSYKALCRFLTSVKPLLGIWAHQNPELGNVVIVMPGFASVVGCRVIPQEMGPSGLEGGPIQWTPVFEVISDDNGALAFVLHGREKGQDYIYPGRVKSVDDTCNVLLLEVEHKGKEMDSRVPFSKLFKGDREKVLEIVTGGVRIQVPDESCGSSVFPCLRANEETFLKDVTCLLERRAMLIKMRNLGWGYSDWNATHEKPPSSRGKKYAELGDFLSSGDTIGLTLQASTTEFCFDGLYHAWPYMDDSLLALYKLPIQVPTVGQEYAGLWGGTFGDKDYGNALFFVVLSYQELRRRPRGKKLLIATKILEGTEYVNHPNGSAMFTVDVDVPSTEPFPLPVAVMQAFTGKGITSGGYGFRCPGSTPGSLFVLKDGVLAFCWNETGSVLTLKRLNLEELLKKGERAPTIPPIPNFSHIMTFFTNVYADLKTMKILGFV